MGRIYFLRQSQQNCWAIGCKGVRKVMIGLSQPCPQGLYPEALTRMKWSLLLSDILPLSCLLRSRLKCCTAGGDRIQGHMCAANMNFGFINIWTV